MTTYDKWISTYRIEPPVAGKFAWGAKANIKLIGTGRTDDAITLSEHLGETLHEAESKATAEALEWITRQGDD
jgi:hypothetical protein